MLESGASGFVKECEFGNHSMRIAHRLMAVWIVGSSLSGVGNLRSAFASEALTERDADASPSPSAEENARLMNGLLALYNFSSSNGPIVKDRSGVGVPVDLHITTIRSVRRAVDLTEILDGCVIYHQTYNLEPP